MDLLGSTSHCVAQHALCPVLIVPDEETGNARRAATEAIALATRTAGSRD
jgi:hypothetical protein